MKMDLTICFNSKQTMYNFYNAKFGINTLSHQCQFMKFPRFQIIVMSSALLNVAVALISIVLLQLDNIAFQIRARMEEPAFQKKMDTDARVWAILKETIVKVSYTI